jgi:P-type E1-E2 ATPase
MVQVRVPGGEELRLEHVALDVNGTLTDRGELLPGVDLLVARLRDELDLHLLSADTFGGAEAVAQRLGAAFCRIRTGEDKRDYVASLGPQTCVAVGNGRNDAPMLAAAGLGIAVVGPEGAHAAALLAADIVTRSTEEALSLLLDPTMLTATLRP